ncbi:DUF5004 domain-containing protein [Niabella ginsengisoli]|uniref:DUF5004 domain-containing protein n=1 Tax=Niabella ginsengisoli TaxID=522298 RepID=A0ABS9SDP4_9BACT|nr:DUF5004 domain-containing protein [Niabella ginsengisoli]MCH5596476.1 DUF5004 domain-containing protein [Niabella ginsengisoli]
MMKPVQSYILTLCILLALFCASSCTKESTKSVSESNKNVIGTWKISGVTRNGVDITSFFDFTPFSIEFKDNGTYVINNQVPFVVSKNGSWSLDDPTHPLRISFSQAGSAETFTNEFNYPVVGESRRIILTGSPGCSLNTYQYSLVEVK